jgi:rubrerythrin/uncharacterized damage-inducible protein DinB
MNTDLSERLQAQVEMGGQTYTACLVAAEKAILLGQFNVTKVLRAIAFAQRSQAQTIARLLDTNLESQSFLLDLGKQLQASSANLLTLAESDELDQDVRSMLHHIGVAQQRLAEITDRSVASLETNHDVLEKDVHLHVQVCATCGCFIEGWSEKTCPICGSLSAQFEWFGPYYSSTPERLGLLAPEQILQIMKAAPEQLDVIIADVDDSVLSTKPTPEEWSVKEIAGHMIAVEAMFADLIRQLLSADDWADLNSRVLPWKLHEGLGYEEMSAAELAEHFRSNRAELLELLIGLSPDLWSRRGMRIGQSLTLLDVGFYIANHDLGHLAQIRHICYT